MQSYEGGRDYIGDARMARNEIIIVNGKEMDLSTRTNLFQHKKERNEDFRSRINMSYYYNFCAPIVDIYTNHLFKKPILENWGNIKQIIERRKENIDGMDGSIFEFRKDVVDLMQIYGHIFVVIDKPKTGQEILTLQDQIDQGAFPYFTAFHPQNVLNWSLDKNGRPYWVLVKENYDGNVDPMQYDADKAEIGQYRVWTRSEWILFNSDGNEIGRGSHSAKQVPIVCIMNKRSKQYANFMGISSLSDIAYISRDVYNACSELKQILRDQTFSILTIQGESREFNEMVVGTSRALLYPENRERPGYISPDSANAETLFKYIDKQISAMFRLAKLEGGSADFKGQDAVAQSGVSKAWDFNETNQALSEKALNMQDAENKLWRIFAAWEGKEFDGSIQYPNEFSVESLNDDLDMAEKELKLNLGKTFNIEIKKAIVKKKFPRMDEKDIAEMVQEIETGETNAEKTAAQKSITPGGRLFGRLGEIQNANSGGQKGGANV
jgi:hypothetical protein